MLLGTEQIPELRPSALIQISHSRYFIRFCNSTCLLLDQWIGITRRTPPNPRDHQEIFQSKTFSTYSRPEGLTLPSDIQMPTTIHDHQVQINHRPPESPFQPSNQKFLSTNNAIFISPILYSDQRASGLTEIVNSGSHRLWSSSFDEATIDPKHLQFKRSWLSQDIS